MDLLILLILFIYGVIFGSFYNVVIYRMPIDLPISKGRSFCTSCNTQLKAVDLVPVFSYLFLKGKCRYCGEHISIRYPLVELFTGLYFMLAYIFFGFSLQMLFMILFWSYLFIVSMIDIDHMLILDNISIFFGIIFIILYAFMLKDSILYNFLSGIFAFIIYFAIYKIAFIYYKREAFGLGDVFFIGVVSFCLGLNVLYLTIFFPFIVAVVFVIINAIFKRNTDLQTAVPLAPFISISAFILSIYGQQMMDFIFVV